SIAQSKYHTKRPERKTAWEDHESECSKCHTHGCHAYQGGTLDIIREDAQEQGAEDSAKQGQYGYRCRSLYKICHVCDIRQVVLNKRHEERKPHHHGRAR